MSMRISDEIFNQKAQYVNRIHSEGFCVVAKKVETANGNTPFEFGLRNHEREEEKKTAAFSIQYLMVENFDL